MKRTMISLTIGSMIFACSSMGFEKNFKRTISENTFFRTMKVLFPKGFDKTSSADCQRIRFRNQSVVGVPNPLTGEPTSPRVGPAYVGWALKCMDTLIERDWKAFLAEKSPNWRDRLGPQIVQLNPKPMPQDPWSLYSKGHQALVQVQVERLIGPEVLNDQQVFVDEIVERLAKDSHSLEEAYLKMVGYIVTRPEFLEY